MLKMIRESNPGLSRRFPQSDSFFFEDYSEPELLKIFQSGLASRSVKFSSEVAAAALTILRDQKKQPNFGNAGSVNKLIDGAIARASKRGKPTDVITLKVEDLQNEQPHAQGDPFEPLNALFNIEKIKSQLLELKKVATVAIREGDVAPKIGKLPPSLVSSKHFSGHFVFLGSPGTGKTTVARTIANILFDLKLIPSNRTVQTSGLNLTGDFLGHTKTKVTKQLGNGL